jgi:hypothetical protein
VLDDAAVIGRMRVPDQHRSTLLRSRQPIDNGAATFTLNGQITYPDGTTWSFHHVDHTTFAEGAVPKHEFSKMHCTQIG